MRRRPARGLLRVVLVAAFLVGGPAMAQACLREAEPNDTPGTATELEGARCFGGTLAGEDQDAFTWRVSEEEAFTRWRIRIEGIAGELTKIDVLDVTFTDDGEGVRAADTLFSHGTRDGREAVSEPFLMAQGRATLGLSKSGGSGDYRVTLEPEEDLASSHDPASGEVTGAFAVRGTLEAEGTELPWTLDGEEAERRWRLEAETALGQELRLRVVDQQGSVVSEGVARGVEPLALSDLALPPGRYDLELGASSDGAPFVLAARTGAALEEAGEREPNDAPEQANSLPTDQISEGSLRAGDVDHFRFEVDETRAQGLFDLVIDTDVDVAVTLTTEEGEVLQQRRGHGGALRALRLEVGTYGLVLEGHGEGPYALSFRSAGSPQTGVEEEPNDTPAGAYPLDDTLTVRGALGFTDVDHYTVAIPGEGGRYRVQVLAGEAGVERVALLDAAGASLHGVEVPAGERRIRLDDVPLAPGEYLLRVEGQGTEYAVRFLDLGELAERPPELEATTEAEDEALEVTTAEEVEETAPPREAEEPGRAEAEEDVAAADGGDGADPAEPSAGADSCRSPLATLETEPERTDTARYADAAAYACGEAVNLEADGPNLRLDDEAAAFRFIWVAASQRGTVVKIDTDTGEVLGEYWTAPVFDPERPSQNPSRSVVDRDGNAWIGNRDDELDGRGSVVKIGLLENGQCEDRDGDGRITTSQGLGDVLPWTNEGDADRAGGVTTAEDECILEYVRVNATGVRHLSVNGDNDVWVSGTGDHDYDLIDGQTAEIVRTESGFDCGGYGGLIDRAGILWSARPLLRWDPDEPLTRDNVTCDHGWTYGLGLAPDDHVWASDFGSEVCRLTRDGAVDACYDAGEDVGSSRGVAVTDDGHVWVAHSHGNAVTRFAPDGGAVERISVGGTPTGIAVDARGKVWVTNRGSSNAMRIDPATNGVDLTVGLGSRGDPEALPYYDHARPYTYSDMTGQLVFGPPESGSWTVTLAGPSFRTRWEEIRYDAEVPEGGEVTVRVSGGEAVSRGGARNVRSGDALETEAPYLTVTVSMTRGHEGASPRFGALEVDFTPLPLDPGSIAIEARPELVANSNAIGVILDASGSMGQTLEGGMSRMDAAKAVLTELADSAFPAGVPVSLRVFGHLEPNTCHTALELPLTPFEPEPFTQAVQGFTPKLLSGTPLAESILAAADDLSEATGRKMVVLVTDGEESCDGDPEAAIGTLRERGIDTINIVGFALQDESFKDRLREWAALGGGRYADAGSGEELAAALHEILQPAFLVLDAAGEQVARGRVNRGPVEVPSGIYSVRVLSTPEKRIDGVRVVERDVALTVALREEAAR